MLHMIETLHVSTLQDVAGPVYELFGANPRKQIVQVAGCLEIELGDEPLLTNNKKPVPTHLMKWTYWEWESDTRSIARIL